MVYDYKVKKTNGEELNLSDYKGKVIMVVNTATGCGFTPQYAPIEEMTTAAIALNTLAPTFVRTIGTTASNAIDITNLRSI